MHKKHQEVRALLAYHPLISAALLGARQNLRRLAQQHSAQRSSGGECTTALTLRTSFIARGRPSVTVWARNWCRRKQVTRRSSSRDAASAVRTGSSPSCFTT